jgi:Asp-tRNA(Asn)/Glu-tRNA(Gln) amidotransferase A subunit family amidase
MSVPFGQSRSAMPIGIQISGGEALPIQLADQIEEAEPWTRGYCRP